MADSRKVRKRKTIEYNFGEIHKNYIRRCRDNTFNILEGAVRSGKTIDNVFAFAHELKTTPDKIHLASGSTLGNAKLNVGDANGFGLEWIFRGQCRWGLYKDMQALIIKGPATNFQEKVVIFAGSSDKTSHHKIRGNSYGMWIATEINLHHDNFIKEAFNRQLAAKNRKIFWDLNPEHPKAPIYTDYLDVYEQKHKDGTLKGGYNYMHCTIFQNINIPQERLEEIITQYDENSIWYARDILGKRSIAEGLVYPQFASLTSQAENTLLITKKTAMEMAKRGDFIKVSVGVDFGGNGSGHTFVATALTENFGKLVALRSEKYTGDIDPVELGDLFVQFLHKVIDDYKYIPRVYCDSAEQVLIRGLKKAVANASLGEVRLGNASKQRINNRIFAMNSLVAQGRFQYTEDCKTLEEALTMAVWKPKTIELERLDDGTSDIDTLDAFEYSFENDIANIIKR